MAWKPPQSGKRFPRRGAGRFRPDRAGRHGGIAPRSRRDRPHPTQRLGPRPDQGPAQPLPPHARGSVVDARRNLLRRTRLPLRRARLRDQTRLNQQYRRSHPRRARG